MADAAEQGASHPTAALLPNKDRSSASWWTCFVDAHKSKVLAVLALMPIIDFVSDLGAFNSLMNTEHYSEACVVMVILLLNWRFVAIYSALTPELSLTSVNLLYCPFAFHIFFAAISIKYVAAFNLKIWRRIFE